MLLERKLLDDVSSKAKKSPCLRMNYNLHESIEDALQRMFNALERRTQISIAWHHYSSEILIMLRGSLRIFIYDDKKNVVIAVNSDNIDYYIQKSICHGANHLNVRPHVLKPKKAIHSCS